MGVLEWVLGGVLIAMALFLVVAVLMQSGKDKSLSGAIGGGAADTFYGKSKGNTWDKVLSRATTVIAILFCILVVTAYVLISKYYAV